MSRLRTFIATPAGKFVLRYAIMLSVGFFVIALKPVNDAVVNPYTTFVAYEGKALLNVFGEGANVTGQILSSRRFAVAIHNGCNGLEAMLIFLCGVGAFPASWKSKLLGALLGFVAIQIINVIRVVSLFYLGVFKPAWFSAGHVFVWQSLVILLSVVLWLVWVHRYALAPAQR